MREFDRKYIYKKGRYFFIQLPGHPARPTGIRADEDDPKLKRENEKTVQRIRDGALRGEPEMLAILGLDKPRAAKRTAGGPTLAEWIDVWQASFQPELSDSSLSSNCHIIDYWRAHFGAWALSDITREVIVKWRADFQAKVEPFIFSANGRRLKTSNANTNQYIAFLSMMLSRAIEVRAEQIDGTWQLAKGPGTVFWLVDPLDHNRPALQNCCIGIRPLPTKNVAHGKHYTEDELEAIFGGCDDAVFEVLLKFGTVTGQRVQDLLDINRHTDVKAYVRKSADDPAAMVVFRQTKNGKPHTMAIPQELVDLFATVPVNPDDPDHVFGVVRTLPGLRTWYGRALERACKAAGVPYMRFHWTTRATAAMRLYEQGCTTREIMDILNWESEAMVRRYVPATPKGTMERGARILGNALLKKPKAPKGKVAEIFHFRKNA